MIPQRRCRLIKARVWGITGEGCLVCVHSEQRRRVWIAVRKTRPRLIARSMGCAADAGRRANSNIRGEHREILPRTRLHKHSHSLNTSGFYNYTIFFVSGIYTKPNPTGPSWACPASPPLPMRPLKSSPTSDSILACSFACPMQAVQTAPSRSVPLNWRRRMVLKASTCSLAHFTHALMSRGGKQAWKVETVFRMMVKYTKDTAQIY